MTKRLLDYDPLTRTQTWHEYDHVTKKTHIQEVQDCEAIIKRNKQLQSVSCGRKGDYFHFATVPNVILYKWLKEDGLDFNRKEDLPKIEKKLRSREWMYLRTCDRF